MPNNYCKFIHILFTIICPTLEGMHFYMDSEVSTNAIFSLEKEHGIPLLSVLSKKHKEFLCNVDLPQQSSILSSIVQWLKLSRSSDSKKLQPTWQSLIHVLHRIKLNDLAWQMMDHFVKVMTSKFIKFYNQCNISNIHVRS